MSTSPRTPRNFFPADLTPLILSGWQTNKFDLSIPFWEEVDGLQFTETSIRRKPGHQSIGSTATYPIRGLATTVEFDTSVIYAGTLTNIYRWKLSDMDGGFVDVSPGDNYTLLPTSGTSTWDDGTVETYTKTNGGSGYSDDEELTFTSSGSGTGFVAKVLTNSGGAILTIDVTSQGSGYVASEVLTEVSVGGGSGAVFTVASVASEALWVDEGRESSWDWGVNEAPLWSFTNFGTWVLGANDSDPIQIKKSFETFTDLQAGSVSGITIRNAGTSYAVGTALTFTSSPGSGFTATITDVDGGAITGLKITAYGSSYVNGTTLTAVEGDGTKLQVDVVVPDCPFSRVRGLDKSGPHILAINYDKTTGTEHPYDVAWCSSDDPDTWVADANNSAGSLTLREATSGLRCIVPLGEAKAIYSDDEMFILNYIGFPYYFGYETAFSSGVGAVSSKAVISVDRVNYGLSKRGFFMTDGNSVTPLGDKEGINKFISDPSNVSAGELSQVVASHNKENNEVTWALPLQSATKTELEITYNYSTGTWSKRTSDLSASAQLTGSLPYQVTADSTGAVYLETGNASAHNTTATTRAHDFDDPYSIKELTSIRVGKSGNGNPLIEIGWAEDIDDTPTFAVDDSFYALDSFREYNIRTSGRFLFLRISSSNEADTWEISNIMVKGRIRGFR